MELFDWLEDALRDLENLDADVIRLSSQTGMGELMKYGCTTCFDHHYVFPAPGDLIGAQMEAADALGMRMVSLARVDGSKQKGRWPPTRFGRTDRGRNHARFDGGHREISRSVIWLDAAGGACAVLASSRSRQSCSGRARFSRGSTMSACIRTFARRRMRKTTCSRAKGCARWRSWRHSAGSARTSGTRTASTSTTKN